MNKYFRKYLLERPTAGEWLKLIIIVCFLWWLAMSLLGIKTTPPKSDSDEPKLGNRGFEAYVESQFFIKNKLQTPSTANFPGYDKANVIYEGMINGSTPAEEKYRVIAYVDAQNPFGVKQRLPYVCQMWSTPGTHFHWGGDCAMKGEISYNSVLNNYK